MVIPKRSLQGEWTGSFAFVFALAGVSIGLGNVWRFPVLAAEHGGGAFLLVYGAFLVTLTLPLWLAEVGVGRSMRRTLPGGLARIAREQGSAPAWSGVGWVAVTMAAVVLLGQLLIGGWAGAYLYRAVAAPVLHFDAVTTTAVFTELLADAERLLLWFTLLLVAAGLTVSRGIGAGIQPMMRLLVPAMVVLLVALAWAVGRELGLADAWSTVFELRFDALGWTGVQMAGEHALFSLAVALGVATAFGAALPDRFPTISTTGAALALDTLVGLVAAVLVFALVSGQVMADGALQAGPALVFHALPDAMGSLAWSRQALVALYAVLLMAVFTTVVGLLEVVVSAVVEQGRLSRARATATVATALWLAGALVAGSLRGWLDAGEGGGPPLDDGVSMVWLTELVAWGAMPVVALALLIFVGWRMPQETLRGALRLREDWRYTLWMPMLRYVAPLILLALLARVAGLLPS
ncbi:sodium-dependent transporter [Aquisalimonas asiatica]|uniref:Neurotransmitter:Na+ symporter, NSS family n=1 Tax=Aquisalimonas asiatica TaxID=406100 RepID=A0A1H8QM86_9GAMM|nr:sodium-dependent transporter [Aquisalimonas asiatica]SEO55302.1 neurotransmitter:Na+ symporter, NSS family [Aquisalimonas asiatica]